MTLLVLSPDFASHYGPLSVIAQAARRSGRRVVVATGPNLKPRVEAEGFEWRALQLGESSNSGVAEVDPGLQRFIEATKEGPLATIRRQALDREHDLLWQPERVAAEIRSLCDEIDPECVLVDHVSFGSTLGMYATGRNFVTLVPGHPSQLPVGNERYGIPERWPRQMIPDDAEIAALETVVDRVTVAFTKRWNAALAQIDASLPPVEDAFRIRGKRVLYNSVPEMTSPLRAKHLPHGHHFVGPLVRVEVMPARFKAWEQRADERVHVYVALGTFLSHRSDVLAKIAEALRRVGARAAIALGPTAASALGAIPEDWIAASQLPQVAMMRSADLVINHGGNNSVQEALSAGVRQIVLPFSTDQFANAADLERIGAGVTVAPKGASAGQLVKLVDVALGLAPRPKMRLLDDRMLLDALFG